MPQTEAASAATPAMTRRERFLRLYDFQPVDRPVRWEAVCFWGETGEQWAAEGGLAPGEDPMDRYGMEPRPGITGNLGLTSMGLSGPAPVTRMVADEGRTRVYENDLGQVWRDRASGVSMPQWLRFPVETADDWRRKILPRLDPAEHDYGDLDADAAQSHASEDPYGMWIVGLYAFWRNLWGEVNLALAFYDCPEVLHEMARQWLRMHCECTPRVLERSRIDYVMHHEDMAFRNGPLIGPRMFDAFMAPYYRELMAHLRAHGQMRFLLDSDGNNGEVLERFADLGINGMYPFEIAAGCDPVAFRERHPRFFIWGGFDKRSLLGSAGDVEREVMERTPALWQSGGYIPSVDHAVSPCPQANFELFVELVRDICR